MLEINLLPWRQLARARQKRQYYLVFMLISVLCMLLLAYHYQPRKTAVPIMPVPIPRPPLQIKYIGYVHQGDRTWALLLFPNGETAEAEVGTHTVAGIITKITEQAVILQSRDQVQHSIAMLH